MKKVLSILLSVMLILSTMTCLMLLPATASTAVGTVTAGEGGYLVENEDGTKTAKAYYGNTFVGWVNADDEIVSYNTTIGAVEEDVVAKFNNYNLIPNGNFEDADIAGYEHTMPENSGLYVERVEVPGTNAGHGSYAIQVNSDSYQTTSMNHVLRFPNVTVEKNTTYVLRWSGYAVYEGTKYFYTTLQSQAAADKIGSYYNYSYECVIPSYTTLWGFELADGSIPGYNSYNYRGESTFNQKMVGQANTHYASGVATSRWVDVVFVFNTGEDITMFAEGAETGDIWFNVAVGNDSYTDVENEDGSKTRVWTDGSPNFYVDNVSLTKVSDTAKDQMSVIAGEGGSVSGPAAANKGTFQIHELDTDNNAPADKGDAVSQYFLSETPVKSQMVTNTGVYTATPAEGYTFLKWVDAAGNTVSTKATDFLANDGTVKAVFGKAVEADEGGYLVDNGDGTVTAKPYYGNTFAGWYDADDKLLTGGEWNTLTVTKDKAIGVTAKFNVYNLIPDGDFESNDGTVLDYYGSRQSTSVYDFSVENVPTTSNIGHGNKAFYVDTTGGVSTAMHNVMSFNVELEKDTEYILAYSVYVDGVARDGNGGITTITGARTCHIINTPKSYKNSYTGYAILGSYSLVWGAEKADGTTISPTNYCYKGNTNAVVSSVQTHASVGTGIGKWIDVYLLFNTGSDTTTTFDEAISTAMFEFSIGTVNDSKEGVDNSSNFYIDNISLTKSSETQKTQVSVSATEGGTVTGPAIAQKPNIYTYHYATAGKAPDGGNAFTSSYITGNPKYTQLMNTTGAYTAVADNGYKFMGWYVGDALVSTEATLDIYAEAPVVAKFAAGPKATEGGYLRDNGDGTVTAVAYYGNTFNGWSNGETAATINYDDAYGATANFTVYNQVVDGTFEEGAALVQDKEIGGKTANDSFARLISGNGVTIYVTDAPGTNASHGDKALFVELGTSTSTAGRYVLRTQDFVVEKNKTYIFAYSIYQTHLPTSETQAPNASITMYANNTYSNSWTGNAITDWTINITWEAADGTTSTLDSFDVAGDAGTKIQHNVNANYLPGNAWSDAIVIFNAGEDTNIFAEGEDTGKVFFSIGSGNGSSMGDFYVDNVSFAEATTTNPNADVNVSAAAGGNAYAVEKNPDYIKFIDNGGDFTKSVVSSEEDYYTNWSTSDTNVYYSPVASKYYEAVADVGFTFTGWYKDGEFFSSDATIEIAGPGNYVSKFETTAQNNGFESSDNPNDVAAGGAGTTLEYATYTDEQTDMPGYDATMGDTYLKVTNTGDSYIDFSVPVSMKAGTRYLVHMKLMVISSDVADPEAVWTEENPLGPEETSRMDFRFTTGANTWTSYENWAGKFTISGPNGATGFTKLGDGTKEDADKNWYSNAWFSDKNQERFGSNIVDLYYDITATEDAVAYVTFGQWAGGEFGVDAFTVTEVSEFAPEMIGATFDPKDDKTANNALYAARVDLPSYLAVGKVESFMGVTSALKAAGRAEDFDADTENVTVASLAAYPAVGYITMPASSEAFRTGDLYTTFTGASTAAKTTAFSVRTEISLTDCYGHDLGIVLSTDVYSRSINQIKRLLAKGLGAEKAVYNGNIGDVWQYILDNTATEQ